MINLLKKAATLVAVALAFTTATIAQAATATVSSGDVTARILDSGTFATTIPGLEYKGFEFVAIDTPSSWYWLQTSTGDAIAILGSNPLNATTISVAGGTASFTGAFGALTFTEAVSIPLANQLNVQVSLTNASHSAISRVKWGVGFDPDQGGSGKNSTLNTILGQGKRASVSAIDTLYGTGLGVTLVDKTPASAFATASYINSGNCCSAVDPSVPLSALQAVGFSTLANDSISLAYDIGTLGAGKTASIRYSYIFAGPIPEPEIYAMMGIGLALMGFVAHRRKGQAAAA